MLLSSALQIESENVISCSEMKYVCIGDLSVGKRGVSFSECFNIKGKRGR